MKQFCEDVLKFLLSEYNDSYNFAITCQTTMWDIDDVVELLVEINSHYKIIVSNGSMKDLFYWYLNDEFIHERNQYRWQKELIDMIEGG